MTRLTRLCRTVGVGLAVTTTTLAMTQAANADPAPPPVPKDLVPTSGQVFLVGHAKGVQIYTCNGTDWGKSTPRADLFDDAGNLIVKHSAGPTWTATADGSGVTGTATAKDPDDLHFDPATAKDIQQLLLKTTPVVPVVPGILDATTYIQRLNTKHGTQPPAAECKAQTAGKVKEVNYTADYYFWK